MKQAVGLIGWRGMVGSVLMQRMRAEGDFELFEPVFFSTSNAGGAAPEWAQGAEPLQDAYDLEALKKLPIIVTCQGGDYTTKVYADLRSEEHTSELQSRGHLVCRLLLEKKKGYSMNGKRKRRKYRQ